MSKNYFGDGSDGNVIISTNTQLTVPNKNGSYDGDMVVMNYNNLTINEGFTLTTDQACRGLLVYVAGNCIINGTLSMASRGASANPTNPGGSDLGVVPAGGLQYPLFISGETDTLSQANFTGCGNGALSAVSNQPGISGNGKIITFIRQGADGGAGGSGSGGTTYPGHTPRQPGSNGSVGQTGGGGGGAAQSGSGGYGSYGSCFSGGSGGGAGYSASGGNATAWGASGGTGAGTSSGGGAGNPGGGGAGGGSAGGTGTGGLLILMVGGNLVVGSNGAILASGNSGGDGAGAGGGGAGGGNMLLAYAGTYVNSGTVSVSGGSGGISWDYPSGIYQAYGAPGGLGSIQQYQVDAGYKISGSSSEPVRIFVMNESNWSLIHNDTYDTGYFEIPATEGKKSVFARRSSGQVVGYGSIDPK